MKRLHCRLAKLERRHKPVDQFQHVHADGLVMICRAGKVIFALPDNGRDCHA
jgi:hypothetical protein